MNTLREMVRDRNNLVHFKPKTKKLSQLDWFVDWVNLEDAVRSCEGVPTVMAELKKLDKNIETDWAFLG